MIVKTDPILTKEVLLNDAILDNMILHFPGSAHIKDTKSFKYVLGNKNCVDIYALNSVEDIIGKDIKELDSFMQPYWGNFACFVEKMDYQTAYLKEPTHDNNRIFLNRKGFIHIQNMTKIPLIGASNKVTAILTMSENITKKTNLFKLYEYYINIYGKKKEATEFFLRHLNVRNHFNSLPTEAEIRVMLSMKIYDSHKTIAKYLNTETKTIEGHTRHIRTKLSSSLTTIISILRGGQV